MSPIPQGPVLLPHLPHHRPAHPWLQNEQGGLGVLGGARGHRLVVPLSSLAPCVCSPAAVLHQSGRQRLGAVLHVLHEIPKKQLA